MAQSKQPGISVPGGIDPKLRAFLETLTERVRVLGADRGNPYDRALTPRDLVDAGIANAVVKNGRAYMRAIEQESATAQTADTTALNLQLYTGGPNTGTNLDVLAYNDASKTYWRVPGLSFGPVFGLTDVTNDFEINGQWTFNESILASDGSDAAPAYSFASHPTTGIGWQDASASSGSADEITFTAGGAHIGDWGALGLDSGPPFRAASGSASAPTFTFWQGDDFDTGFYRVAEDTIGVTTGGTLRLTFSSTYFRSTVQTQLPAGSATAPAYSFTADPDTGIYNNVANRLSFGVGGTEMMTIQSAGIDGGAPFRAIAGSVTAPALSFWGDANTGFYSIGADNFGASTGGTLRWDVSTTAITTTLPRLGQDGTAAAPAYSFSGDTNTGVFRQAADALGIATNGAESARFDASTTAGDTRFMLYDVDNATLERVTVGAADSGGAGFKLLRIPN